MPTYIGIIQNSNQTNTMYIQKKNRKSQLYLERKPFLTTIACLVKYNDNEVTGTERVPKESSIMIGLWFKGKILSKYKEQKRAYLWSRG